MREFTQDETFFENKNIHKINEESSESYLKLLISTSEIRNPNTTTILGTIKQADICTDCMQQEKQFHLTPRI